MTIWWIPSSGCQEHSPEKNRPSTSAASSVTRRGWTNVYEATGEMYAELIDMFFRSEMGFRAVIVDKSQIDETRQDITKTSMTPKRSMSLSWNVIVKEDISC